MGAGHSSCGPDKGLEQDGKEVWKHNAHPSEIEGGGCYLLGGSHIWYQAGWEKGLKGV